MRCGLLVPASRGVKILEQQAGAGNSGSAAPSLTFTSSVRSSWAYVIHAAKVLPVKKSAKVAMATAMPEPTNAVSGLCWWPGAHSNMQWPRVGLWRARQRGSNR